VLRVTAKYAYTFVPYPDHLVLMTTSEESIAYGVAYPQGQRIEHIVNGADEYFVKTFLGNFQTVNSVYYLETTFYKCPLVPSNQDKSSAVQIAASTSDHVMCPGHDSW
jgi:hypothetical protein